MSNCFDLDMFEQVLVNLNLGTSSLILAPTPQPFYTKPCKPIPFQFRLQHSNKYITDIFQTHTSPILTAVPQLILTIPSPLTSSVLSAAPQLNYWSISDLPPPHNRQWPKCEGFCVSYAYAFFYVHSFFYIRTSQK